MLAAGFWLSVAGPAAHAAEMYRWIDDEGVPHFTTDRETVPRAYRRTLGIVQPEEALPVDALPMPPEATPPVFERATARARRPIDPRVAEEITRLEAEIASHRDRIKTLISQARTAGDPLTEDPELRELSQRLPRLQSELDALRSGSDR